MEFKNGYKVVYEVAANGERTFYATKSNSYPPRDADGKIVENEENVVLARFNDADYNNTVIYEYKGNFYVSEQGQTPRYNEDGTPADTRIAGFDAVLVEDENNDGSDEPVEPSEPKDEEPKDVEPEDEEPEDEELGDDEPDASGDDE